jgi:hypothetical protein
VPHSASCLSSVLAACATLAISISVSAQDAPRLLPPADSFGLTLREQPNSTLPLGSSCGGNAGMTLTCRAFVVTLENLSKQTVRVASDCKERRIVFERKEPHSSSGWWPVSQSTGCRTVEWQNVRLTPGESTAFETRLISSDRNGEPFMRGSYTLRASLTFFGCTESPDQTDCLTPLEAKPEPPSTAYQIDFQEPVTVVSNEIVAESPALPDMGKMSFSFDVVVTTDRPGATQACTAKDEASIDCIVFKYRIVNLGAGAIRYSTFSCSSSGIAPEYRDASGQWSTLPQPMWICNMNILVETPILPGGAAEGEFTLRTLAPAYDTTPLRPPGEHRLRFRFCPDACFASPDGRFCIASTTPQQPVLSPELTVRSPD